MSGDESKRPPAIPRHSGNKADEVVAAVIPHRNPNALLAYYLGLFSIIPILGLLLGAIAFVCGILGFRHARREPEAKGRVHAAIGIGCGGVFFLLNAAAIALVIYASFFVE